jgi:hypothetical protein
MFNAIAVGLVWALREPAMSLNEELRVLRMRLEARRPPELVATMRRAVDELRASGSPARVVKVGELAPRFTLPNAEGAVGALRGAARPRTAGDDVLPRPVVTLLQRGAGSSTEDRAGHRSGGCHAPCPLPLAPAALVTRRAIPCLPWWQEAVRRAASRPGLRRWFGTIGERHRAHLPTLSTGGVLAEARKEKPQRGICHLTRILQAERARLFWVAARATSAALMPSSARL